jgi:hypothetical protein
MCNLLILNNYLDSYPYFPDKHPAKNGLFLFLESTFEPFWGFLRRINNGLALVNRSYLIQEENQVMR